MKIGDLARLAGVTTSRIRFYEARGLLQTAVRTANGYRDYGERDLKIIAFIERAQRLGFSLREIKVFLDLAPSERSRSSLLPALAAKLVEIDAHLREVQERRSQIVQLIQELERQPRSAKSA